MKEMHKIMDVPLFISFFPTPFPPFSILTRMKDLVILCITRNTRLVLRISEFEWDEGNALHLQLRHGIIPEEAEEVFVNNPLFRRTKKGHYAVFGPTSEGRYLTIVFELKPKGIARPITGWDMSRAEIRYYKKHRR